MLAFKTEGIVLKRRDFGEADRILVVFTLARGKISVVAKGVRRITSRRAGNVELLNRVSMFLYPGKQLFTLTEATAIDTYQKLKEDLTLSTYAYHILELVDKLTVEEVENRILYELTVRVLERLSSNPRQIWVRAFEVKVLSNLGFVSFQEGLGPHVKSVNPKVEKLLKELEIKTWDEIGEIKIGENMALELERILRYYVERLIEGKLKSRRFLKWTK